MPCDPQPQPSHAQIWEQYDSIETALTEGLSERLLELAQLQPGMRVLDLATGRGEPACRAAHRVAPDGTVLGIEPDAAIAAMAERRAAREGLHNFAVRVAPAESLGDLPQAQFDVVTARWGLMYMQDPVAVLRHAHRALRRDGLLVAAMWCEPERVDYVALPRQLLSRHRAIPAIDRDAPGTFRYADMSATSRDFAAAGFTITHTEELVVPVFAADTTAEVITWCRTFGMQRLLQDLPAGAQLAWEHDFDRALRETHAAPPFLLTGTTRLVVARR